MSSYDELGSDEREFLANMRSEIYKGFLEWQLSISCKVDRNDENKNRRVKELIPPTLAHLLLLSQKLREDVCEQYGVSPAQWFETSLMRFFNSTSSLDLSINNFVDWLSATTLWSISYNLHTCSHCDWDNVVEVKVTPTIVPASENFAFEPCKIISKSQFDHLYK